MRESGPSSLIRARGGVFPLPLECPWTTDQRQERGDSGRISKDLRKTSHRELRKADQTKLAQSPNGIKTSAIRKAQRVLVIEDSSLRCTEAPICCPDNLSREVCCFSGANIHDTIKKLMSPVGPKDYHPFLLFQVGSNDVATRKLQNI